MDKFTASNGLEMTTHSKGAYLWEGGEFGSILGSFTLEGMQALREFFRAEEDERLGRWRHPEHSEFTVTRNPNGSVYVHNETTRKSQFFAGRHSTRTHGDSFWEVARDYYDAHPERKPWHDAKPGEVWELTVLGVTDAFVAKDENFLRPKNMGEIEKDNHCISAGHRIWPQN